MTKKRIKGFTLIELLATIIIISILFVIASVLVFGIFDDSDDIMDATTKKMVLNAAEQYAIEFRNSSSWKEEASDKGTKFCITLDSLINYGYFGANESKLNEYKGENIVIEMTINKNGVYNSEIITQNDADSNCKYFKNQTEIADASGSYDITDTDNNTELGKLEYDVSKVSDEIYNANVDLNIKFEKKNIEQTKPVYVALVIDNSGSMNGDSFEKAKNAAIELSENIINNPNLKDSAYIALVQYTNSPLLKRGFANTALEASNFEIPGGNTNTSGGIDMVSYLYSQIQNENALFYTILLYDGAPTHYSYMKYNGNYLYSTSNNENYFKNFGAADSTIANSTCNNTSDCVKYLTASSNYLKNTLNSKLITIGYNFSTSSYQTQLKETSSQDNQFCEGSDHFNIDISGENKLNDVVGELVQTTSVYNFKVDGDGSMISTNNGVSNSRSHSYIKIDLTNKGNYSLTLNTTIDSSSKYNFGYIYLTNQEPESASSYDVQTIPFVTACNNNGNLYTSSSSEYSYVCYFGQSINNDVTFNLSGNSVYYLNLLYIKYGYEDGNGDYFKINSLKLTPRSNTKTEYEEVTTGDNLTLSNGNDTIRAFKVENNKLVSNNKGINHSQSYSYETIDLSSYSGKYILQVNASVDSRLNDDVAFIYVNQTEYSPQITANHYSTSYVTNWNYTYKCSMMDSKCISGKYDGKNYYFSLEGGKIYYVHFIYNKSLQPTSAEDIFTINDLTLYKTSNTNLNDGGIPLENDTEYIKKLVTPDTYGFKDAGNGAVVSNNSEINSSTAYSYNEIDLTSFASSEYYMINVNVSISSNYNYDLGSIFISESTDKPVLDSNRSCTLTSGGDCLTSISGIFANYNYYGILQGGKKYYIHYLYAKGGSVSSYNDNFIINSLTLSKVDYLEKTDFPINNKTYFTSIKDGVNYNFKTTDDGKIVSTNGNIKNTLSHSYVKVDLTNYSGSYKITVDRIISSLNGCGYGYMTLSTSDFTPGFENVSYINLSYSRTSSLEYESKYSYYFLDFDAYGNNSSALRSITVSGGKDYYIHLIYARNSYNYCSDNTYTWQYTINNIKIEKVTTTHYYNDDDKEVTVTDFNSVSNLYIPLTLDNANNYSFEKNADGHYINQNTSKYNTFAHAYTKIDLTNYDKDKEYYVSVLTEYYDSLSNSSNTNYSIKRLILTTTPDIPRLKSHYIYTSGDDAVLNLVNGLFNIKENDTTKEYYMVVKGGQVYYLHLIEYNNYYNGYGAARTIFTIKDINVYNKKEDYYCYYNSSSEKISTLFEGVSNKIIETIETTKAKKAKIILEPGKVSDDYAFYFIDENGNKLDNQQITTDVLDLTKYLNSNTDEKIELHLEKNNMKLKLNSGIFKGCQEDEDGKEVDSCSVSDINLFNIKVVFSYNDDFTDIKEIIIENVPKITISSNKVITIN